LIDPRAIVDPSARLGAEVVVGPWSVIGADVELGDGCRIEAHAMVKGPARLGRNNHVHQFASIGEEPASARGDGAALEVGDDNLFREGVTVYRGVSGAQGSTRIGSRCLFKAYAHVGQGCLLGDAVVLGNHVVLEGQVLVGAQASVGAGAVVLEGGRVGTCAQIAPKSLVRQDVPAYVEVTGNPARALGLSEAGLQRGGVPPAAVEALRRAYRQVFGEGRLIAEAEHGGDAAALAAALAAFRASVEGSRWGIVAPLHGDGADGG